MEQLGRLGLTIDEADFKANAVELAKLRSYGWTYAVIDEGWYMGNPFGDKLQNRQYVLDAHGLLIPARGPLSLLGRQSRVQAAGRWVHAQGLKFGLHIVRGIPKQAVEANLPIAGSSFHAIDAADTADTCGWDDGNYGVRDNPAGQAYYDSMLALYASWGLDFIKVDCIADHPYKASEIRQIAAPSAKRAGRLCSASRPVRPSRPMPPKSASTPRCGASPMTSGTAGRSCTSLPRRTISRWACGTSSIGCTLDRTSPRRPLA